MKNLVLLVTLFSLSATTFSCAQTKTSQKEAFKATYTSSKALVESQAYQFIGEVVYSNKNREKLDANTSFISVNGSEITGNVTSLKTVNKTFDVTGTIEDYKITYNDEDQRIAIEFKANGYNVFIDIKPNGNAFLTVSTDLMNTISWTGKLKKQ